jgi:hypothetical protein
MCVCVLAFHTPLRERKHAHTHTHTQSLSMIIVTHVFLDMSFSQMELLRAVNLGGGG